MLAKMRSPVTLRELMIRPVRTGYIGQESPDRPERAAAERRRTLSADRRFGDLRPITGGSGSLPGLCERWRRGWPGDVSCHGGGFTVGQSEDTAYIASRIAAENGMAVVGVNYRLAPEWPFPAVLDDCTAVLRWMRKHGAEIGGDPTRIAVAGDSSGGNFAAALPLRARAEGIEPPDAGLRFARSPTFTSRNTIPSSGWLLSASSSIPPSSASFAAPTPFIIGTGAIRRSARRAATCADILPP